MPGIRRGFAGEACELPATVYDPNETIPDISGRPDPRCWVRAIIYPIKDELGRVTELVLIHEDISDRVQAEEERHRIQAEREALLLATQRAHHEAETASRVKDEFLATLSHELRTPLNAVIGWARLLRAGDVDARTTHALDVIERNAWAQTRMIDDLLDVSRIVTGKFNVAVEEVDVAAAALSAIESVRPSATAKRIRLVTRIADDLPRLPADAPRLQQLFWNLLTNAVKFTDAGGRVTMTVDREEHAIAIVVSDTGIGIPPEMIPHIFDRFMQGDSSTTRAHSGLGLGLAIVRHVVELHGGSVAAASDGRDGGATFRVQLPLPATGSRH